MSKTEEAATIPGCGVPAFAAPIARRLNPKLLLLGKWTAAAPHGKETHFMLPRVIQPQPPATRMREHRPGNRILWPGIVVVLLCSDRCQAVAARLVMVTFHARGA